MCGGARVTESPFWPTLFTFNLSHICILHGKRDKRSSEQDTNVVPDTLHIDVCTGPDYLGSVAGCLDSSSRYSLFFVQ
jgi:hypothetical protein